MLHNTINMPYRYSIVHAIVQVPRIIQNCSQWTRGRRILSTWSHDRSSASTQASSDDINRVPWTSLISQMLDVSNSIWLNTQGRHIGPELLTIDAHPFVSNDQSNITVPVLVSLSPSLVWANPSSNVDNCLSEYNSCFQDIPPLPSAHWRLRPFLQKLLKDGVTILPIDIICRPLSNSHVFNKDASDEDMQSMINSAQAQSIRWAWDCPIAIMPQITVNAISFALYNLTLSRESKSVHWSLSQTFETVETVSKFMSEWNSNTKFLKRRINDIERNRVSAALFCFPSHIASSYLDSKSSVESSLVVCDSGHNRLIEMTSDGSIIRVIGEGVGGWRDGNVKSCAFYRPSSCQIVHNDSSVYRLYVADTLNHAIRCVFNNIVSTVVMSNYAFRCNFAEVLSRPQVHVQPKSIFQNIFSWIYSENPPIDNRNVRHEEKLGRHNLQDASNLKLPKDKVDLISLSMCYPFRVLMEAKSSEDDNLLILDRGGNGGRVRVLRLCLSSSSIFVSLSVADDIAAHDLLVLADTCRIGEYLFQSRMLLNNVFVASASEMNQWTPMKLKGLHALGLPSMDVYHSNSKETLRSNRHLYDLNDADFDRTSYSSSQDEHFETKFSLSDLSFSSIAGRVVSIPLLKMTTGRKHICFDIAAPENYKFLMDSKIATDDVVKIEAITADKYAVLGDVAYNVSVSGSLFVHTRTMPCETDDHVATWHDELPNAPSDSETDMTSTSDNNNNRLDSSEQLNSNITTIRITIPVDASLGTGILRLIVNVYMVSNSLKPETPLNDCLQVVVPCRVSSEYLQTNNSTFITVPLSAEIGNMGGSGHNVNSAFVSNYK